MRSEKARHRARQPERANARRMRVGEAALLLAFRTSFAVYFCFTPSVYFSSLFVFWPFVSICSRKPGSRRVVEAESSLRGIYLRRQPLSAGVGFAFHVCSSVPQPRRKGFSGHFFATEAHRNKRSRDNVNRGEAIAVSSGTRRQIGQSVGRQVYTVLPSCKVDYLCREKALLQWLIKYASEPRRERRLNVVFTY